MLSYRWLLGIGVILVPGLLQAGPSSPKFIGKNGHWQAFTYGEKENKVCFMVSEPITQEGQFTKRGKPHILVTHAPGKKSFDTVSIVAGYTYKPQSDVETKANNETFTLFTNNDTAWAKDETTDKALVEAMKAGTDLKVDGTSSRGNVITDTYSLSGFTATYNLIGNTCPRGKNRK